MLLIAISQTISDTRVRMLPRTLLLLHFLSLASSVLRKPNFNNNVCKHTYDYLTIWINRNCWFNPDVKSTTNQMIVRRGYPLETYTVTTEDGYILTVYRIPHDNKDKESKRQPVFLQHGLLMDSAIWVDVGNRSLAFQLVEMGYDVWLGNFRGGRGSLGHINMTNQQNEFWNFSFNEMGLYDLPAMLGLVVEKTQMPGKIIYIGHSMGTTSFYIFSSRKPEMAADYITGMISLAPVAYLTHIYEQIPILRTIFPFLFIVQNIIYRLGLIEIGDSTGLLQNTALEWLCGIFPSQFRICSLILFTAVGFNVGQLMPEDLPLVFNHGTVSGSTKSSIHYAQFAFTGRFAEYDYGKFKNKRVYGTPRPPLYDIKNIKVPIHLYYGPHDILGNPSDAKKLYAELETRKSINHISLDNKVKFNHIDFLFAKDVEKLLYVPMFSLINNNLREPV